MEIVIYCRVSTPQQASDGNGLRTQFDACIEACGMMGWDVIAVFSEIGSGDARSPRKLPARHQAVSMARKRDALLMVSQECRFSREMPDDCPYWDFITDGRVIEAFSVLYPDRVQGLV